ncbi:MAG: hypothetical protein CSB23_00550 [Deltaproteobacteria bacterium]|nr:MAG: hypothetical protein CSB23_00550 [Deltaproteobacteria bacterium]
MPPSDKQASLPESVAKARRTDPSFDTGPLKTIVFCSIEVQENAKKRKEIPNHLENWNSPLLSDMRCFLRKYSEQKERRRLRLRV